MRRLRNILTAVMLSAAFAVSAESGITWLDDSHDFGAFNEECGEVSCMMRFVNTGDEPVAITNARVTCGCTTPEYSKGEIAPGDTASIKITFSALGRPGRFKKKVYIYTSASDERYTLTISGVVIGEAGTVNSRYPVDAGGKLKLRNDAVAFGEMNRGKIKTTFLDGYNQSVDTLRPEWKNVPEYLSVISAPQAVAPGEQVTFSFYLNTSKCPDWGLNDTTVTLIPDTGCGVEIPVSVGVVVNEDFSRLTPGQRLNAPKVAITPGQVDFGTVKFNDGTVTGRFEIGNEGKSTLEIRRIYTADPGITITCGTEKVKKGKKTDVTVNVDTSKINPELLNARINVITNDPDNPLTVVRVVGEVKQ